jgi:UDP-N-acetylglucosamine/UDP-N-acetylgalactosamine diphosphorylase
MIRVESAEDQALVSKVYEAKQEQVFRYWDTLPAADRRALLAQIASIDFSELGRLVRKGLIEPPAERGGALEPAELLPAAAAGVPETAAGLEALRRGEVGVFLVAGGQGTRLGFEGPKGCFPLLPITGATLFQHFAEKIVALGRRVRRRIPWFIMTSRTNDEATREFFRAHRWFGLSPDEVNIRPQAMLPVVDAQGGKILLSSPSELVLGPNGHGGAVRVMQELREAIAGHGVRHLFYHQVDNPLVRIADPAFIGLHIRRDSQFSSKAIEKRSPEEKVGVFCRDGDRVRVVEYTELGERERHARDAEGRLRFRAGNIATHVFAVDFVAPEEGAGFEMPYHIARKAVSHLSDGVRVDGATPNSVRFESFIFDILPRARHPVVLVADREREFAPVKNAEGENSPTATRRALVAEWAHWLEAAGVEVPRGPSGDPRHPIEISPLVADTAEELAAALAEREIDPRGPILLRG